MYKIIIWFLLNPFVGGFVVTIYESKLGFGSLHPSAVSEWRKDIVSLAKLGTWLRFLGVGNEVLVDQLGGARVSIWFRFPSFLGMA